MQQQGDQPSQLDYARSTAERRRKTFHAPIVIATTVLIAPLHFGAFLVSAFLGYSCCSSNGSASASTVAHVLGFPMLHLAWLLQPDQTDGFLLMGLNSLTWGVVIGTGVSFLSGAAAEPAA